MRAIQLTRQRAAIVPASTRSFGYQLEEIRQLQLKFNRKLNVMRLFGWDREFNYEQP